MKILNWIQDDANTNMQQATHSINIIFFGSFQHYSTYILKGLLEDPTIHIQAVVSTPPRPAGRDKKLKKTHTHKFAEKHNIPIFTPQSLNKSSLKDLTTNIQHPISYFLTAGYGKILPTSWLEAPKVAPLNLHFSLLPAYRGANPAEWALLLNEKKTGITLMIMDEGLDTGDLISQASHMIKPDDTRESIYESLYKLGAQKLPHMLTKYHSWQQRSDFNCQKSLSPSPQPTDSPTPYARMLKRDDGYIPWSTIEKAMKGQKLEDDDFNTPLFSKVIKYLNHKSSKDKINYTNLITRASRALINYPGLWTKVNTFKRLKRMKIHSTHIENNKLILDSIQLEGLSPTPFAEIKNQII